MDTRGFPSCVAWVWVALTACHPDTPRVSSPIPSPTQTATDRTDDTGTTATAPSTCAITAWPALVDRSSMRPCTGFGQAPPGCFAGEVCTDRCRIECGGAECPEGETCEFYEWTTTGVYDKVFYSLDTCHGATGPALPEGPMNGLTAFSRTSLPQPASILVGGEGAVWALAASRLLGLPLGPDHLPDGTVANLGAGPLPDAPTAGLEAHGRLYLLFGDRVFSAAATGTSLGSWREEASLPAAVQRPAFLDAGEHLVVAAGTIDGAPSPLVQVAEVRRDGAVAPWTRTFVSPVADGDRHAAIVGDELVLLAVGGHAIHRAPLSTLPEPEFESVWSQPHALARQEVAVAVGSLCDALVIVGAEPSLSTQLLPWDPTGGPDQDWRLGSLVAAETRAPLDVTTHGSWLYVLGADATTVWSAGRGP